MRRGLATDLCQEVRSDLLALRVELDGVCDPWITSLEVRIARTSGMDGEN